MKIKNVTVKKIIVAKNVKTLAPNAVMMDTFMMAMTRSVKVSLINKMLQN